jgi:hypothetical protein
VLVVLMIIFCGVILEEPVRREGEKSERDVKIKERKKQKKKKEKK